MDCNGDEGDPGAFMDRSILEGDPHSVLEGMAICALAIEAEEGFLYIRDEYSLAVQNVRAAIQAAEERGILGERLLGTDKKLHLSVVRGGGGRLGAAGPRPGGRPLRPGGAPPGGGVPRRGAPPPPSCWGVRVGVQGERESKLSPPGVFSGGLGGVFSTRKRWPPEFFTSQM